jgi:hypothetical protein
MNIEIVEPPYFLVCSDKAGYDHYVAMFYDKLNLLNFVESCCDCDDKKYQGIFKKDSILSGYVSWEIRRYYYPNNILIHPPQHESK